MFPATIDPMSSLQLRRVATRGAEVLQSGTVDLGFGTVIPSTELFRAAFFGSTDGVSQLSNGRVFGTFGDNSASALAIDPEDGAIWIGGFMNRVGKSAELITLDGITTGVETNSAFLFVFTR